MSTAWIVFDVLGAVSFVGSLFALWYARVLIEDATRRLRDARLTLTEAITERQLTGVLLEAVRETLTAHKGERH